MKITASVRNAAGVHEAEVSTGSDRRTLTVPAKTDGMGSSVNGGELLFLALATCYCNDVYREAAREGLRVDGVEVMVSGSFGERGAPATGIRYSVRVESPEPEESVRALIAATDRVAEVQNTLRQGVKVELTSVVVR